MVSKTRPPKFLLDLFNLSTVGSMVRLVRAAGGEVRVRVSPKPQTKRNNHYKKQGMKKAAQSNIHKKNWRMSKGKSDPCGITSDS